MSNAADFADLAADRLTTHAAELEASEKGDSMASDAQARTLAQGLSDVESALLRLAAAAPERKLGFSARAVYLALRHAQPADLRRMAKELRELAAEDDETEAPVLVFIGPSDGNAELLMRLAAAFAA